MPYILGRILTKSQGSPILLVSLARCSNLYFPSAESTGYLGSLDIYTVQGIHTSVLTLSHRATPQPLSHVLILDLIAIHHRHAHAHKTYDKKKSRRRLENRRKQIGWEKDEEGRLKIWGEYS